MKITHFIYSIDKSAGGTVAYLKLLSEQLRQECDLTIVSNRSISPVSFSGINLKLFDLRMKNFFHMTKQFESFLRDERPDIVHINGIWTPQNWLFQKAAQKLGIKVILSPHGMLEPYILNRHPAKKKLALWLYQDKAIKNANYIHTTAQSEKEQIKKLGYNQPAVVIPNGVDISKIKQKTKWVEQETFQLLFLSRIHPKKGIELLVEAISKLKSDKFKVTIAGEGEPDYISELKSRCTKNGVSNKIEFIGGIYGHEKWELYSSSDLFVLPTYSENFGIVIAEALATGIPVITTTGTPWCELKEYNCGWWINPTVGYLTDVLTQFNNLPINEIKKMGQNGRRLVEENYDIKIIGKKMIEFYQSIISKK